MLDNREETRTEDDVFGNAHAPVSISEVTERDMIRNEYVRASVKGGRY